MDGARLRYLSYEERVSTLPGDVKRVTISQRRKYGVLPSSFIFYVSPPTLHLLFSGIIVDLNVFKKDFT